MIPQRLYDCGVWLCIGVALVAFCLNEPAFACANAAVAGAALGSAEFERRFLQ